MPTWQRGFCAIEQHEAVQEKIEEVSSSLCKGPMVRLYLLFSLVLLGVDSAAGTTLQPIDCLVSLAGAPGDSAKSERRGADDQEVDSLRHALKRVANEPLSGAATLSESGFGMYTHKAREFSDFEQLVSRHPEMKGPLLRKFLLSEFSGFDQRSEQFSREVVLLAKMTDYQRMSLSAERYARLVDTPISQKILLPQADIGRTIMWLFGKLR